MEVVELFLALQTANGVNDVEKAIHIFENEHIEEVKWIPVGFRENNRGTIEASADPGRSLVERVTNGIDAVLELEHERHNGYPDCRSPREAASTWLNVPNKGLSKLTISERRKLADKVRITLLPGDGKEARIVEVRDEGIGISLKEMPNTILSLNESNKLRKHYVAGLYGQGGSSTFAVSKYTLIASRYFEENGVNFTIIKYLDLPAEEYKTGHYVYLTYNGNILQYDADDELFQKGTQVLHFGYDLSKYSSPVGPNSVYGLLQNVLFDPILPIWLDNRQNIDNPSRRVIKGSRNALNGAIDEDDENTRGPEISHSMDIFFIDLGEWGRIGIEYWVLQKPDKKNTVPVRSFVNPNKPVILSLNGQSHAEFSKVLIKNDAGLPYLASRLIGHIDCNYLSPQAKRALFVSNREEARGGAVQEIIQNEFINALKSDDELKRLNDEAMRDILEERDENAQQQMRNEVAKILRVHGYNPTAAREGSISGKNIDSNTPVLKRSRNTQLKLIELKEPPTYIKILWDDDEIPFYPGQRRYLRIETDAMDLYHNPNQPSGSRINVIVNSKTLKICGTTPLSGGRMRVIVECDNRANINDLSQICVELFRSGMNMLYDQKDCVIVEIPPTAKSDKQLTLPPFEIYPVNGEDRTWYELGWPENSNSIASCAIEDNGVLRIYYSTAFPKYSENRAKFEKRDVNLAESFTRRYEVWLVVHSLILQNDKKDQEINLNQAVQEQQIAAIDQIREDFERQERCRLATISSIVAEQEIRNLNQVI